MGLILKNSYYYLMAFSRRQRNEAGTFPRMASDKAELLHSQDNILSLKDSFRQAAFDTCGCSIQLNFHRDRTFSNFPPQSSIAAACIKHGLTERAFRYEDF